MSWFYLYDFLLSFQLFFFFFVFNCLQFFCFFFFFSIPFNDEIVMLLYLLTNFCSAYKIFILRYFLLFEFAGERWDNSDFKRGNVQPKSAWAEDDGFFERSVADCLNCFQSYDKFCFIASFFFVKWTFLHATQPAVQILCSRFFLEHSLFDPWD